MKNLKLLGSVLGGMLLTAGCGHLDTTAPGAADRVLTGMVNFALEAPLPTDAVVTVRIIDTSNPANPVNVLGETTIANPGKAPIPFRIEYRADDEVLMHPVNVDARITFGGKLRFYSVRGHPLTLGNAGDSHVVQVEPTSEKW